MDTLDIDQDGDLDYIYILDGVLYVKYGWSKIPNKIQDTAIKISDIASTDPLPYIPDYFHEEISTPKNLNFSFTPSLSDETEWRMEFYDRYTEWDRVDIGTHTDMTTPKGILDMFLSEPPVTSTNTGILTTRVRRSLTSVGDPASWILAGRTIDIYTGALSISLSPGRVLYTGKDAVTLTYKNTNTPTPRKITLDPYTGYQWNDITEIVTTGGRLYRIGAALETARYTYSDDLIGMPILPGMRLYSSDRGAILRDHTRSQDIRLPDASTYLTYDLGSRSDNYDVSVSYPDGYYYARLADLTKKKTDRAGIELLAPQIASDDSAPIIEVPSRVRVPIYGYRTLSLDSLVTDMSRATIQIDGDITVDSDKNGTSDDDFATSGSGFALSTTELRIGGYPTPALYTMQIRATDEMGNTSMSPLVVEAYTPIPQIQSLSSTGNLIGSI